jgi:epoxyqueuosine reductase
LSTKEHHTTFLKQTAKRLGFAYIGISEAGRLDDQARQLEAWLEGGNHGKMSYMENHFEKRIDPTRLVPGAKSVVSLLYNYHNPDRQKDPEAPRISQYAFGEDYHHVIKEKLHALLFHLQEEVGAVQGRCFVDSAPVMERAWAERSGLGWNGKHTLLIHPRAGSYFFLAELMIDLPLQPDQPLRDFCGSCRRCIDACPTGAIAQEGYMLDASKCISYLTIELKGDIPTPFGGQMENWMFGCDICQEVCPWNRFATRHQEPRFDPTDELFSMTEREWIELTREVFNRLFRKSAVKRTRYQGLKRNIKFIKQQAPN